MKNKIIFAVSNLLFLLTISLTAHAEIYKWTDDNGVTHYTATPPSDPTKGKNIQDDINLSAGKSSASNTTTTTSSETQNTENTPPQSASQSTSAEDKNKGKMRTRKEFCDDQSSTLSTLKANELVRWTPADGGNSHVLTAKERNQKIAELEKSIAEVCSPESFAPNAQ